MALPIILKYLGKEGSQEFYAKWASLCLLNVQTNVSLIYVLYVPTYIWICLGILHAHIFGGHSLRKC